MKRLLSIVMSMLIMLGATGCEQAKTPETEIKTETVAVETATQKPEEHTQTEAPPTPTNTPAAEYTDMRIHFIDVGQGDSNLSDE